MIRNGGAQTAYLQRLRLAAAYCWQSDGSTAGRAATSGAAADAPGRVVRCQYVDHYGAAQGGAAARLAEYARRRAGVEATLPLQHAANAAAVVEGRISDVVAGAASAGTGAGASIAGVWLLEGMAVEAAGGGGGTARWWLTAV